MDKKLTKRELEILKYIEKNPKISALAISDKLGISSRTVEKYISNLKKVKRIGADKGGF